MNVLALDLALLTGWAATANGMTHSGTASFEVGRDESKGLRTVRLGKFLAEMNRAGPIHLVVFEQAHHRGAPATSVAERFIGKVLEFCALHGIEHKPVHSATLKKWATGSGRAGKQAMIDAALNFSDDFCERYNTWQQKHEPNIKAADVEREWSDEADAICLLHYALAEIVPAAAARRE